MSLPLKNDQLPSLVTARLSTVWSASSAKNSQKNARKDRDLSGFLPGCRWIRRHPYPSPCSLAAFELSFSPPSSPPLLSRSPAACNCLVINGENLTGTLQWYVERLNGDTIVIICTEQSYSTDLLYWSTMKNYIKKRWIMDELITPPRHSRSYL